MQFSAFLKEHALSISQVARNWGMEPSTLSRMVKGDRWPSAEVLVKTYHLTRGRVNLLDWMETCSALLKREGVTPHEGSSDGATVESGTSTDGSAEAGQGPDAHASA